MVLAFLKIAVKLRQKTNIPVKTSVSGLKFPKMSPKTDPKSQKTAFWATPHQRQKKHVANPKNEPKKLKNPRFFHFFLAEVWRAGPRTSLFRTVFYSVFWRRASRPIKNRRFFQKKRHPPPPPVNLNLSWLMPSGWSRPLHLRCGRICNSGL